MPPPSQNGAPKSEADLPEGESFSLRPAVSAAVAAWTAEAAAARYAVA